MSSSADTIMNVVQFISHNSERCSRGILNAAQNRLKDRSRGGLMARRTDHSREELADLVVGAAETLARREGLRGIAMRRIAAEIGYAAGSIYNAVGDLEAVVLRVNARTLERLRAALVRLVDPARPPIENALAIADGYLDFVARQPRLWGVILEHVLPPGSDFPDWYEKALAATTSVVDEVLKPLVADEGERRHAA